MDKKLIVAGFVFIIIIVFGFLFFMNQTPVDNLAESEGFYFYYDAPIYTATLPDIADELASDETKGVVRIYKSDLSYSGVCPNYNAVDRSEIYFGQAEVNPLYHDGDSWGYYIGFANRDALYKVVFLKYSSGTAEEKSIFFETKNGQVNLREEGVC